MKCRYLKDVDACMRTLPDSEKHLLEFRPRDGKPSVPYFPAGTVRDCKWAPDHVKKGVAEPADQECADAVGWTKEQLAAAQHRYARVAAGIHPNDYPLFDAGVILGYEIVDGHTAYVPGPNYAKWKAAQDAAKAKLESDV